MKLATSTHRKIVPHGRTHGSLPDAEGVYVTIVHSAFCLFLYLTGIHFRSELQDGGDVSQQKISVDQSELEK